MPFRCTLANASIWAAILISAPFRLPAVVVDTAYKDFAAACSAALLPSNPDNAMTLSHSWAGIPSQTCAARLIFTPGALLRPAANAELSLTGNIAAAPAPIFDISAPGSAVTFGPAVTLSEVYPQWWGAVADRVHDDTPAIQAALDAVRGKWNGFTFSGTAAVVLPGGIYRTTTQLRVYGSGHPGRQGYENYVLRGAAGTQTSTIAYAGPPDRSAIRWIGGFGELSHLSISDIGSGWISGVSYDGDPAVFRSSKGVFDHVFIDCRGLPGDGIDIGATCYQADQLSIRDPYINGCTSGAGVNILDSNALSVNLYNPSITACWIAIRGTAPSVNIGIFGGEIDSNDVNFYPAPGDFLLISGVRSENSKRTLYTAGGTYAETVTLIDYDLSSLNFSRPPTSVTAPAGSSTVILSTPGFTLGDAIVIARAGKDGSDLHTYITSMSSPVTATLAFSPIVTAVRDAAVTLDSSVPQHTLIENALGPYVHINSHFNPESGATASVSLAPQIFIGNSWTEKLATPFGSAPIGPRQSAILMGNLVDTSFSNEPMMNATGRAELPFKPQSASQDVSAGNFFVTSNRSDTVIDTFVGGIFGQTIQVFVGDTHTSFASTGNLQFPGPSPMKAASPGIYQFVCRGPGGPWAMLLTGGR